MQEDKNTIKKRVLIKKREPFLLEDFLSKHVPKKSGAPSHDYLARVGENKHNMKTSEEKDD